MWWFLALLLAFCVVVSLVVTALILKLEFRTTAILATPALAGIGVFLWLCEGRHYWWAIIALISSLFSISPVANWLVAARAMGIRDEDPSHDRASND
jgi:hypothetical protein